MDNSFESIMQEAKSVLELFARPIFQINGTKLSVFSIIVSFFIVVASFRVASLIGKGINRALKNKDVDSGVRDSIEKFTKYVVITVGILFSMDNMGISIKSLAAVGAILMVGIGFGLQNITQNFISGIILLFERPVKVGDIIQVGNSSGRVIDIRVRSTLIQTRDDLTIIVPNSKLLAEEVISESYSGHTIRKHIKVGVAYGSDVDKVKALLLKSLEGHKEVLESPPAGCVFEDFGDSSLVFDLRFWCSNIWEMERVCGDIRCDISRLFREENIEIPFPQRDLHIRSSAPNIFTHG